MAPGTSTTLGDGTVRRRASFLDGLRYDLEIEACTGGAQIRMVFNPPTGEELVANIDGKFAILDDGKRWVGSVKVERAYYNFTKRFDARERSGTPGDFQNPELDITATYAGSAHPAGFPSGTVRENIVRDPENHRHTIRAEAGHLHGHRRAGLPEYTGPKSSDVGSDAIQFLITGNFPLTESQKNDIAADLRSTVGTSLVTGATSLLSSHLSDFLRRETGFINSIEIGYGARGPSVSPRISGQRRRGRRALAHRRQGARGSLQQRQCQSPVLPWRHLQESRSLRNFMFELERRVEANVGQVNERKETNSARLFYRFSF